MWNLLALGITGENREIATWLKRLHYENCMEVQARLRLLLEGRQANQIKGLMDKFSDKYYLAQCLCHNRNI